MRMGGLLFVEPGKNEPWIKRKLSACTVMAHSLYLSTRAMEGPHQALLIDTTLPLAKVSKWSAYHCIMAARCVRYWALL